MRRNRAAQAAVVLGAVGVVAIPIGTLAAQLEAGLTLLASLYITVPLAIAFGLLGLLASRHARLASQRTVFAQRRGPLRTGRLLAWVALYVGASGGIALIVYSLLRARH